MCYNKIATKVEIRGFAKSTVSIYVVATKHFSYADISIAIQNFPIEHFILCMAS